MIWSSPTGRPTGDYHEYFCNRDNKVVLKVMPTELQDNMAMVNLDEYAKDVLLDKGRRRLQLEQVLTRVALR